MVYQAKQLRHFLEHLDEASEGLAQKGVFFFLDYDGTLTPIVDTPDLAVLSEPMRDAVQDLARRYPVSIVSGRATDDVRKKVNLKDIFYAGSHGFEIVDPQGRVTINQEAKEIQATIDQAHAILHKKLSVISGALVEHVKYTVSVHYRLVSEQDVDFVKATVEEILKKYPQLKMTHGKKVMELRPRIDWDKGKAVEWILNVLKFDSHKHAALYIGDDRTDEDAFAALKGKGLGVLVAPSPRETKADYFVRDVQEVLDILNFFIKQKK